MKTTAGSFPQYWHIPPQGRAKFTKYPLPAECGGGAIEEGMLKALWLRWSNNAQA
jgi:hypothetical protein